MIWRVLRHYDIPQKIVNIIQSFYNSCIHNTDLSAPFTVNTAVTQGCILSSLIFSLVIDWVLKTTMEQPKGIQWIQMQKLQDLDFLTTLAYSRTRWGICRLRPKDSAILEINATKTKSMRINASQEVPLTVDYQAI